MFQDLVVSVCLCDTSGSEDVHVNDSLVSSELALVSTDVYDSDVAEVDISSFTIDR